MDGYEDSRGLWVDSTKNPLTYLPWCKNEPSGPMKARFLGLWDGCDGFDDDFDWSMEHVVCVKCSSKYSVPKGYSCLATDFGIIIVKSYNQIEVSAFEARSLCAKDADYVHLPMPINDAQNIWYKNYAKSLDFTGYWLGVNDVESEGEWRTDTGDLQTYLPWKSGFEVTLTLDMVMTLTCLMIERINAILTKISQAVIMIIMIMLILMLMVNGVTVLTPPAQSFLRFVPMS